MRLRAPSREVAPIRRRAWAIGAIVAKGLATHRVRHMALPRLFAIEAGCRPIDRAADENDLGRLRGRPEEHTSELQSLMRLSYAVFCLKKKRHLYLTNHT